MLASQMPNVSNGRVIGFSLCPEGEGEVAIHPLASLVQAREELPKAPGQQGQAAATTC